MNHFQRNMEIKTLQQKIKSGVQGGGGAATVVGPGCDEELAAGSDGGSGVGEGRGQSSGQKRKRRQMMGLMVAVFKTSG